MLKALMGFPSQSLVPDLKPLVLTGELLLPCRLAKEQRTVQLRTGSILSPGFEALFLKTSSTIVQRGLASDKGLLLSQGFHP